MDVVVSIIIPVYNTKSGLCKCINSIISQNFENFEVVLVDDGSTDGSGLICDDYAGKYDNIQAFHQSNSGVSNARNLGIAHSKGEYFTFVDADDYVGVDFLNLLMPEQDFDFVYANSYIIGKDHPCIVEEEFKASINDKESFEKYFYRIPLAKLSPWNKLYKRCIIEEYNIRFNEKFHYGEDTLFVLEYLNHCDSISMCGLTPYYYDDSPGKYKNLSHSYLLYWLNHCLDAYSQIISKWESSFQNSSTLSAVVSFQRNNYYWILNSLIDDKVLSLIKKLRIINSMRNKLISSQKTTLLSKKEKIVEICLLMPKPIISYWLIKVVSLIKK